MLVLRKNYGFPLKKRCNCKATKVQIELRLELWTKEQTNGMFDFWFVIEVLKGILIKILHIMKASDFSKHFPN